MMMCERVDAGGARESAASVCAQPARRAARPALHTSRLRAACVLALSALLVSAAAPEATAPQGPPPPSPRPAAWPAPRSGLSPLLDELVLAPAARAAAHLRCGFRGVAHAVRDVLFPEFRGAQGSAATSEAAELPRLGLLDTGFVDESEADLALRARYRAAVLDAADKVDATGLHQRHPEAVRAGLTVALGALMLAVLGVSTCVAGVCARVCMGALLQATGSGVFEDAAGLNAPDGSESERNPFGRMFDEPHWRDQPGVAELRAGAVGLGSLRWPPLNESGDAAAPAPAGGKKDR